MDINTTDHMANNKQCVHDFQALMKIKQCQWSMEPLLQCQWLFFFLNAIKKSLHNIFTKIASSVHQNAMVQSSLNY